MRIYIQADGEERCHFGQRLGKAKERMDSKCEEQMGDFEEWHARYQKGFYEEIVS